MRHVPQGNKWHTASDDLAGSAVYGDPSKNDEPWSIKFDDIEVKEFLFAKGDWSDWMIMTKD